MQLEEKVQFSGNMFSQQGAYLSTFTPHKMQQYLMEPQIPAHSYYHLVGCRNPLIMNKANTTSILDKYIESSNKLQNTIIDICLPFYDPHSTKLYMGRYIIFRGKILGIRLNTNAVSLWPSYSSWPRHKIKNVRLSRGDHVHDTMIGQFILQLFNIRIGLLFNDELKIRSGQYTNLGLQLITLAHHSSITQQTLKLRNLLSKNALILQNDYCSFMTAQSQQEESFIDAESHYQKLMEQCSSIEYYSFQKIYARKYFLHLQQEDQQVLQSLRIDLAFAQPKQQPYLIISQTYQNSSIHIDKPQPIGQQTKVLDRQSILKKLSWRIHNLLEFCNNQSMIVIMQERIQTLILCYLLNHITEQEGSSQNTSFIKPFKFVIINNNPLLQVLNKLDLFQNKIFSFIKQLRQQSKELNLVKVITEINEENDQSFFPIFSNDPVVFNVIHMLNKNEDIKAFTLETLLHSENVIFGKTWVVSELFTHEQIHYLFENEIKSKFIQDEAYLTWILQSNIPKNNLKSKEMLIKGIISCNYKSQQSQSSINQERIHSLGQQFNQRCQLLSDQIKKIIRKDMKSILFSHFLFRKFSKISIQVFKSGQAGQNSLFHELMITKSQSCLQVFSLLTGRSFASLQNIGHRRALNMIMHSRRQQMYMKKCHKCQFLYMPQLVYECKTEICGQIFCYECLLAMSCVSLKKDMQILGISQLSRVKLCPICRNICNASNCKLCSQKLSQKNLQEKDEQCHICRKEIDSSSIQCKVQGCNKFFCINCIHSYYKSKVNTFQIKDWICFCCKGKCKCNKCSLMKRQVQGINNKLFKKHDQMVKKGQTIGKYHLDDVIVKPNQQIYHKFQGQTDAQCNSEDQMTRKYQNQRTTFSKYDEIDESTRIPDQSRKNQKVKYHN